MRKFLSLALVTGAIALMPFALRADTIKETFSLAVPTATAATQPFSTTAFAEFNPTNGTLNSATVTLTGSGIINSPVLSNILLLFHNTNQVVGGTPGQVFPRSGAVNINISTTANSAFDLAFLTGTGTTVFDLLVNTRPGGTFETTSPGGLAGTVAYNYTPAPPTPAPESSLMVQLVPTLLGLLAFGWWMERRKIKAV